MDFLHKIKDSPNYNRLKNSAQYRYDRRQFLIMSVIFGIIFLMFLPLFFLVGDGGDAASFVLVVFMLMGYFLVWLYFLYRWLEIYLYIDSYIFCHARLDQPHVHGRGGASFTVEFTDRHGNRLQREPGKMFSSQWEPYLEEYNNQTVLIGYNEKTDRLIVMERINA